MIFKIHFFIVLSLLMFVFACSMEPIVYNSEEECESQTKMQCSYQACDDIPTGKSFEEICGKNFKKGWIPVFNVPGSK